MSINQQQSLRPGIFQFVKDEFVRAASNSLATLGSELKIESSGAAEECNTPLWFVLKFNQLPTVPMLVGARRQDWMDLGKEILSRSALATVDEDHALSPLAELWSQVAGSLAESLTRRLQNIITAEPVGTLTTPPFQIGIECTAAFQLRLPSSAVVDIKFVVHPNLPSEITTLDLANDLQRSPSAGANNLDLLLDVEMPVSVSFGRAQLPLKDVIKLTTGSIVELSRSVSEPVDIIVNNCVIARGEVVVVDGNFGVRIKEISSRQERLSTLR